MPVPSTILLFLLAALALLVIPGPSVLYIMTRSLAQGRRAGLASVAGVELAALTHTLAAAFGLSALLLASALAFSIVKYLGAAYLIFLGLRTILRRDDEPHAAALAPRSPAQLLAQGYLVNLLNPKTALFFYAFLPQFADPARGPITQQILLFGVLFATLAFCTDSLYALLGSSLGARMLRVARFRRARRYATGGVYIALGVTAAVAGNDRG